MNKALGLRKRSLRGVERNKNPHEKVMRFLFFLRGGI